MDLSRQDGLGDRAYSPATVDFHLQKSLRKLGTSGKYQAATKAMQAGLI
jgi:DNA-binding CsgD family transcriptional regulator